MWFGSAGAILKIECQLRKGPLLETNGAHIADAPVLLYILHPLPDSAGHDFRLTDCSIRGRAGKRRSLYELAAGNP